MNATTPLRAGIVGVGMADGEGSPTGGAFRIAYLHAQALKACKSIDLVSAADISERNLAVFQERFSVNDGHGSLQAMLDSAELDVVHICTYVGLHLNMLEACAAAGIKGVICEKPLVISPAELKQLRDLAESTGMKVMVPHFRRYLPVFIEARDIYNSGEIGEPVSVMAAIGDGWDLSEWGSHWLDMFRFFHNNDMPKWVMAQARVRDRRGFGHAMEDHAVATMQFPNGGHATLDVGPSYLPDSANMVLTGTRGCVVVRDESKVSTYSSGGERHSDHSDPNHGTVRDTPTIWAGMFDEFAAWINGGPESSLGLGTTGGSAELNLACYMSMVNGDRIDFPMQSDYAEWPVEELARRRET